MANYTIELMPVPPSPPPEIVWGDVKIGEPVVVTSHGGAVPAGRIGIRANTQIAWLHGGWDRDEDLIRYRFRRLKPDESIVITPKK